MSQGPLRCRQASRTLVAFILLAVLGACGGDGAVGSGGTGADLGQVQGTVNGFGSVIVDGSVFDVRDATVGVEVSPGQVAPAEVKLGHRVAVDYETPGVATTVRVEPTLVGPVSAVTASGMVVLGQTVTVNRSVAAGPLTVFGGGYQGAADPRAGDSVEVHALVVASSSGTVLQATRIDRIDAPAWLRVSGVVSARVPGSGSFALGALVVDAASAAVLPTGSGLANGDAVSVFAPASSLTAPAPSSLRVVAAQVRKSGLRDAGLDDVVSGRVAGLDRAAKTFTLGGLRVRFGAATVSPGAAALDDGAYVQVRGMAASGQLLDATAVTVRSDDAAGEIELKGNISAFDATARRFVVRGVTVAVGSASIGGCPAAGLADGLFVEVHGVASGDAVAATQIECKSESAGSTIEREGRAGSVDVAAMGFALTTETGSVVPVRWTASTYFGRVTPQTLAGRKVEVEGSLSGATLVATKVKLAD